MMPPANNRLSGEMAMPYPTFSPQHLQATSPPDAKTKLTSTPHRTCLTTSNRFTSPNITTTVNMIG